MSAFVSCEFYSFLTEKDRFNGSVLKGCFSVFNLNVDSILRFEAINLVVENPPYKAENVSGTKITLYNGDVLLVLKDVVEFYNLIYS